MFHWYWVMYPQEPPFIVTDQTTVNRIALFAAQGSRVWQARKHADEQGWTEVAKVMVSMELRGYALATLDEVLLNYVRVLTQPR